MRSDQITSSPQQIGDIINEQIQHSNAPLWEGLRAYRATKGGHNGQTL